MASNYDAKEISVCPDMLLEARIGVMGLNRLVLSPQFGSTILLNSIFINAQVDYYDQRREQNPCLK